MRIAIHDQPGGPSDVWIAWCEEQRVPYRRVDCFSDQIIEQLLDCDGLIWWWGGNATRFAVQLTRALEVSGKLVFPGSASCWHFDDKIGQKYLFEAAGLPLARTHVFYDREKALSWSAKTDYPKVFKLRSGAWSENVWLVKSPRQAARFIERAFGRGFTATRRWGRLMAKLRRLRYARTPGALRLIRKGVMRRIMPAAQEKIYLEDRGYAYFQEIVPGTSHSFLVLVSEARAYAVRSTVRTGDFRASGSGLIEFGHPRIVPKECIGCAFEAAKALGASFLALEMLVGDEGIFIIETDPFFYMKDAFPGFWDSRLQWHEGSTIPAHAIIHEFLRDLQMHGASRQEAEQYNSIKNPRSADLQEGETLKHDMKGRGISR